MPAPLYVSGKSALPAFFRSTTVLTDHFDQVHKPNFLEFLDFELYGGINLMQHRQQRQRLLESVLALRGDETNPQLEQMFGNHFASFAQGYLLFRYLASRSELLEGQKLLEGIREHMYLLDGLRRNLNCNFWLTCTSNQGPLFVALGHYAFLSDGTRVEFVFHSVASPAQAGAVLVALDSVGRLASAIDHKLFNEHRLREIRIKGDLHPGTIEALVAAGLFDLSSPAIKLNGSPIREAAVLEAVGAAGR
jgi:hypothetical protein